MIEPISFANLVITGLNLANKWRQGKLNEDEAKQLYSKIFSSLLFEIKQTLDRCLMIKIKHEKEEVLSAGILSFFVRESLFTEFCMLCPEPKIVSNLNEIYSAFERVHHWQRQVVKLDNDSARFIIAYVQDIFEEKKLDEIYNELVDVLFDISPLEYAPKKFNKGRTKTKEIECTK